MKIRKATISRKTTETDIFLSLEIDGSGESEISSGVGFFDHMLTSFTKHSRINLKLKCAGDLDVDDHHTVEDCAIALGQAFDQGLGDKKGCMRFGSAYAPLDEALVRAVVDLSGRPFASVNLKFNNPSIGAMTAQNLSHAIESFALSARITVHIDVIRGENDHHIAEAAFKALAIAMRQAVQKSGGDVVPSTKGVL
jgi:imidazoleglycerol-phosphate dehydratase